MTFVGQEQKVEAALAVIGIVPSDMFKLRPSFRALKKVEKKEILTHNGYFLHLYVRSIR